MTESGNGAKPATTLQTAKRALRFLEYVAQSPKPPRLKDVATDLELNITTCYHLSNTLQQAGYLLKGAEGTLRIGGRAAILYQGMLRHFTLGRDLHPIVEGLSAQTSETAYLTSLSGDGVVIQALVEGTQAVRVSGLYVGFSGAEHTRASGKAVLAHLADRQRQQLLSHALRGLSSVERDRVTADLADELEEVRERGWALDDRRFDNMVCCVAAPFFGSDGMVAGSVAVSIPAQRFPAARSTAIDAVIDAAAAVSQSLGYQLSQAAVEL